MSIRASNIKKSYNGRVVLEANIEFKQGRLYSILGPNGSGKSTLLKILAQLEKPDMGTVTVDQETVTGMSFAHGKKRPVLVPARNGLFNDTVLYNVSYGLKIQKTALSELKKRAEEVLKVVGLWELRRTNALTLSDGEAQRLCLAMALAIEPEIILLDEPTSSLDPQNTIMVENIIQNMKKTTTLIIMVTHNIFQAKRLSDHTVFLWQGKILEVTAAESFFEQPATDLANNFLKGEMIY